MKKYSNKLNKIIHLRDKNGPVGWNELIHKLLDSHQYKFVIRFPALT